MTDARRPVHLAVLFGASAGLYAFSLAGVMALQSSTERATALDRAPVVADLDALEAANDRLTSGVDQASSAYDASSRSYDEITPRLGAAESRLAELAAAVADVQGAARALPTRVALPSVRAATPRTVAAPKVQAKTGASGG
jgi:uncharacterized protein YlxW (UPF0749 family)